MLAASAAMTGGALRAIDHVPNDAIFGGDGVDLCAGDLGEVKAGC
jgi:hypothetical protein